MTRGTGAGQLGRELLGFGPHAGAHRVAARAGVSVLVPLLVLLAAGRLEWSIYATFGAFTALYGRERVGPLRVRLQTEVGVLLTAVVAVGTLVGSSEHRAWVAVPTAALLTIGAAVLSDRQHWHPPGALFPVFALTACASIPGEPSDALVALLVAGCSAAFSLLVGNLGAWLRRRRATYAAADRPSGAPGARAASPTTGLWRHVLPSGVAVLLAGSVATGVGIGHPYWAMVSAVVPLAAADPLRQLVRGLHRLLGTGVGLALAGALLALDLGPLATVLAVVALQVAAELLVGRNYALALVVITPLALLMVHLVSPVPTSELLVDRGTETLVGVVIGLAVGWLARRVGSARAAG
ncbi:FUSC family protein [Nocardioides sp. Arc9.136]|uniref:FUSC family protein n=1 Tax=Nocardioides sp. Arc9.136 TaxID=2996826 RepID=UPI00266589A0|nr:FUSC family protein [Nocardioides sp. Arc9.136]WKN49830.1 FUSC family protein [Nocardioides sp. Arc9.136]